MKKILLPTDFSANADNAIHYAVGLCSRIEADLFLLHVNQTPYDFAARKDETIQNMTQDAKKKLKEMIATLEEKESFENVKYQGFLREGNVVHSIMEVAEETGADLIVMGTKGASGLKKAFFGSNTAELIRRTDVPVLAVPEQAAYHQTDKVVYAVDYREDDLDVLKEVVWLATQIGLNLHTIHVAPHNSLYEQILHRGLVELVNQKMPFLFTSHQLKFAASFSKGIEEFLNENPGTLLVMAHYRRPFIDSLLTRSITIEMAYQPKSPILIFNLRT